MALMQLVAHSYNLNRSISYHVDKIMSVEIFALHFDYTCQTKLSAHLSRTADIITLKHLEIHTDIDITIDQFKLSMLGGNIELSVRENDEIMQPFITYDFELIMELEDVRKINGAFIIKIPFEYTIKELNMIAMKYSEIHVSLNFPKNSIKSFKLFCENIFLDTPERVYLAQNPIDRYFTQFGLIVKYEISNIVNNKLSINLLSDFSSKGYFIKGETSKIKNILFNESDKYHSVIVGPNLIFVSNKNMTNFKHFESFKEINDSIGLSIEFNEPTEIKTYEIIQNNFIHDAGFVGFKYAHPTFVNNDFITNRLLDLY